MPRILRKTTLNYQHEAKLDRNKLQWAICMRKSSRLKSFVAVRVRGLFLQRFQNSNSQLKSSQVTDKNKLVLSENDSKLFISVMQNPPEPSEGLLSLFD